MAGEVAPTAFEKLLVTLRECLREDFVESEFRAVHSDLASAEALAPPEPGLRRVTECSQWSSPPEQARALLRSFESRLFP